MKKSLLVVILLALFAGFSTIPAQTMKPAENSALLYEISGNGLKKPSYLFGTIHIICSENMIALEKFDGYFDKTDQVFMELDFDDPNLAKAMGEITYLKDGKTLADYLTAEQYAKVGELVQNFLGIPIDNVKNFHPFLLSIMISTSPKSIGCNAPGSYELSFVKSAAARKKTIEGLESVAMEMQAINTNPIEKQVEGLYKMALEPGKSVEEYKQFVEVYKTQNSDKIYESMQKYFAEDPTFQVNLLDNRNKDWIPKIEKAVKEKPSFIAVGAGHLGGKNGVLNLLRAKGYKVRAIKL